MTAAWTLATLPATSETFVMASFPSWVIAWGRHRRDKYTTQQGFSHPKLLFLIRTVDITLDF